MRFRAGDDLLARIRASLVRQRYGPGRDQRKNVAIIPPIIPPAEPPVVTYYGRLGEMGHPADRAYPDDGEW